MKRLILSILLISALIFGTFCLAEGTDCVVGNPDDFVVDYIGEAAIAITDYTGNEPHLAIPPVEVMSAQINTTQNLEATIIHDESFAGNNTLQTLYIPEGYTNLHYRAFYGCENLTTVYLPSTMISIESEAFAGCTNLTTLVFPQGGNLRGVDDDAFAGCAKLQMTPADFEQLMDTEFFEMIAAKEQAQAEFVVDTSALTELSGYLGTDVEAFGQMMNAEPFSDSACCGYNNEGVVVTSYSSWKYIEEIALRQKCNYSICGVYVSMNAQDARSLLRNTGWQVENQWEDSETYVDASDNWFSLSFDGNGAVSSVYLSLNSNSVERLYDDHDGSSLFTPSAQTAAGSADSTATARTTAKVNMRSGAGLDFDTIGSVPSGASVEFLGEESVDSRGVTWYRVRYNGSDGWCSSKYVVLP